MKQYRLGAWVEKRTLQQKTVDDYLRCNCGGSRHHHCSECKQQPKRSGSNSVFANNVTIQGVTVGGMTTSRPECSLAPKLKI